MITNAKKAQRVVTAVLDELRGRKGFDNWWDDLDEDIREEICETAYHQVLILLGVE